MSDFRKYKARQMLDSTFRTERAKTHQANRASYMEIATRIASQGTMCHTHKREKGTNMLTAPEMTTP